MRILVVEDEKKTASFIRKALRAEGFAVDVCHDGEDALHLAATVPYDALVLDIMLPGRDGLSVLRQLRERRSAVPVLLLSARGEVNERVEGLDAGADDYLPKPFALAELVARVRAMGRRGGEARATVLQVADLALDTVTPGGTARRGHDRADRPRVPPARVPHALAGPHLRAHDDPREGVGLRLRPGHEPRRRVRQAPAGEDRRRLSARLIHTVRGVGYVLREAP